MAGSPHKCFISFVESRDHTPFHRDLSWGLAFDTRLNMEAHAKVVGTKGFVVCVALRCTWCAWVAVVWCVIYCCEVQGLLM